MPCVLARPIPKQADNKSLVFSNLLFLRSCGVSRQETPVWRMDTGGEQQLEGKGTGGKEPVPPFLD
jgi:hypothetical protein